MKRKFSSIRFFTIILMLLVLVLSSGCFEDVIKPSNKEIISVTIDSQTLPEKIFQGEFFNYAVKIAIAYEDDTVDYIFLSESHIDSQNLMKLGVVGTHQIKFTVFEKVGYFEVTIISNDSLKVGEFSYKLNTDYNSYRVISYSGDELHVVIPSEVEGLKVSEISSYAFKDSKMKSVYIPSSITAIRAYAFQNCGYIEYLYIPNSVKVLENDFLQSNLDFSMLSVLHFQGNIENVSQGIIRGTAFSSMFFVVEEKGELWDTLSSPVMTTTGVKELNVVSSLELILKNDITKAVGLNHINAVEVESKRAENFDEFISDLGTDSFPIDNSEQLLYAVKQGYKPIFKTENSSAHKIYLKAKQILREIIGTQMTDLDKANAIHDYLASHITYDGTFRDQVLSNTLDIQYGWRCSYLEGAILDEVAVCDGYAKAFMLLTSMEGIECERVTGTHTETYSSGIHEIAHAWNKVCIDDVWYLVDVTKDSLEVEITKNDVTKKYLMVAHSRFMLSDKTTLKELNQENPYIENGSFPPSNPQTEYNYYMSKGTFITDFVGFKAVFQENKEKMQQGYVVEICLEKTFLDEIANYKGGLMGYMEMVFSQINYQGLFSITTVDTTAISRGVYLFFDRNAID